MRTPCEIENIINKINSKYPFSTDKTNYGEILYGVAYRTDVHDIIKDLITVIDGIAKFPYNMSEHRDYLYGYMNTCILNNYEFNEASTLESFCKSYINIRAHKNSDVTRERIVQIATNRGLSVENAANDIRYELDEFEKSYKLLKQFTYNSNGYNQQLVLCKKCAIALLNYKFDPYGLPYGFGFYSNIFTEVKKDLASKQNTDNKPDGEKSVDSNILITILSIIICGAVIVFIIWSGPLFFLFLAFVGVLLLKCMR